MELMYEKTITKEIITQLEELRFAHKPNFSKYDTITYDGELIMLFKDEVWGRNPYTLEYEQIKGSKTVIYQRDSISGVFIGTNIK